MEIRPQVHFLRPQDIKMIHDTSLKILAEIGLKVPNEEILSLLKGAEGITVDEHKQVVTFREKAIIEALDLAPHVFSIYGRDKTKKATYGSEGFVCQCNLGSALWVDPKAKTRREGRFEDLEKSVVIADALPNIDIVGGMVQPAEIPVEVRDVRVYAELFKRTRKPTRTWVFNRISARYILELLKTVAGGEDALRSYPMSQFSLEPISPLRLPSDPLDSAIDFARAGIPIAIAPMPQAMATAPVTLAGAVAQGNAEILGTLAIIQAIVPGTPIIYYNAAHIMDPRTSNMVFSSPEQALMGLAIIQLGKSYGLPVGVNLGLTDAKVPDAQAGIEKGSTMILGALAGADVFGAMGIAGCDQGSSLPQLVIDDEMIGFVRRVLRGSIVNEETCAYEVIERVGIGGQFLTDDHTLEHWREEFWIPTLCDRYSWAPWYQGGAKTMLDRAIERQEKILQEHTLEWLDEETQRELDAVVAAAEREILGA